MNAEGALVLDRGDFSNVVFLGIFYTLFFRFVVRKFWYLNGHFFKMCGESTDNTGFWPDLFQLENEDFVESREMYSKSGYI